MSGHPGRRRPLPHPRGVIKFESTRSAASRAARGAAGIPVRHAAQAISQDRRRAAGQNGRHEFDIEAP